jgi:NTP pyrophosphatase (non-canonical NTP hydrolase)
MTPNEYQQLALRTENTPSLMNRDVQPSEAKRIDRLLHALFGMCTEAGEAQDMLKKHLMYGKAFDAVNILEECGDSLWYIALALDACGFTMEQAMERNIAKLRTRYPEQFTEDAAINRDLDAERKVLEDLSGLAKRVSG